MAFGDGVPPDRLKPALKVKRDQALQALGLNAQSWAERLSNGWHPDNASASALSTNYLHC